MLAQYGVTRLDFIIASHYDADHIGGTITGRANVHGTSFILGPNGEPGAVVDDDGDGHDGWLDTQQTEPDADELGTDDDIAIAHFVDRGDTPQPSSVTYDKYAAMANAMGERITIASRAQVEAFDISLGGTAALRAVAANGFVRDRTARVSLVNTENERSLCFLLSFDGFHYLIGGDTIGRAAGSENAAVEKAIGEYLVDNDINVDVLHVNHHGANNGSEAEFLDLVAPEVAIISLGNDNDHSHPDDEALTQLVQAGVF